MSEAFSRRTVLATLGLALAGGAAHAESWPTRPLRLVIPFPPGGSTDIVGRLIGDKLAQGLGQAVVVENRSGAGGTVGSEYVAKAPADGYTLGIGTSSTHAIAASLYPHLAYDPSRDFAPISLIGTATIMMVVHPSLPVHTVAEFIKYAKARPHELMFGSTGNGSVSHLTAEYFKSQAGVDLQHVPYKGDSPMALDLIANRVQVAFSTAVAFLPYVKQGKLRALAVTDAKPSPVAPDLPTVASSGLPGFEALQWFGLLAPAGTPKEVVARLNAETTRILQMPDVQSKLRDLGMQIMGGSPERFGAFIRSETAKWGKIVHESGAKID
jgi:tripartite-type tricarboxylate transporter receptor subunit TctC